MVDDIFIAKIKRVRLWRSIAVVVRIAVMIRLVTAPALFTSCFFKLALRMRSFEVEREKKKNGPVLRK